MPGNPGESQSGQQLIPGSSKPAAFSPFLSGISEQPELEVSDQEDEPAEIERAIQLSRDLAGTVVAIIY